MNMNYYNISNCGITSVADDKILILGIENMVQGGNNN